MKFINAIKNILTPNKYYFNPKKCITVVKRTKMNGTIVWNSFDALNRPMRTVTRTPLEMQNVKGHHTEVINHRFPYEVTNIHSYSRKTNEILFDALENGKILVNSGEEIKHFMRQTRKDGKPYGKYFNMTVYPRYSNQVKVCYDQKGNSISAEQVKTNFLMIGDEPMYRKDLLKHDK